MVALNNKNEQHLIFFIKAYYCDHWKVFVNTEEMTNLKHQLLLNLSSLQIIKYDLVIIFMYFMKRFLLFIPYIHCATLSVFKEQFLLMTKHLDFVDATSGFVQTLYLLSLRKMYLKICFNCKM